MKVSGLTNSEQRRRSPSLLSSPLASTHNYTLVTRLPDSYTRTMGGGPPQYHPHHTSESPGSPSSRSVSLPLSCYLSRASGSGRVVHHRAHVYFRSVPSLLE